MESESGGSKKYNLRSALYPEYLTSGLSRLLEDECSLTDVTLACEGQFIKAHRVVLVLCSPFFKEFFRINHVDNKMYQNPLIVLSNVTFANLKNIIQFIYHGNVTVSDSELQGFLEAARTLQIQGLATELENSPAPSVKAAKAFNSSNQPASAATSNVKRVQVKKVRSAQMSKFSSKVLESFRDSLQSEMPTSLSSIRADQDKFIKKSLSRNFNNQNYSAGESSSRLDPLNEESAMEEDGEEMISMDAAVKSEPIEVHPLNTEVGLEELILPGTPGNRSEFPGYEQVSDSSSIPHASTSSEFRGSAPAPSSSKSTDDLIFDSEQSTSSPSKNQLVIRCKVCNLCMTQEAFRSASHSCVKGTVTGVVDPVVCPDCGSTLKNPNSLKVHKSTYHRKQREGSLHSGVRLRHLVDIVPDPTNITYNVESEMEQSTLNEERPVTTLNSNITNTITSVSGAENQTTSQFYQQSLHNDQLQSFSFMSPEEVYYFGRPATSLSQQGDHQELKDIIRLAYETRTGGSKEKRKKES